MIGKYPAGEHRGPAGAGEMHHMLAKQRCPAVDKDLNAGNVATEIRGKKKACVGDFEDVTSTFIHGWVSFR
jgi:hypothetical protein